MDANSNAMMLILDQACETKDSEKMEWYDLRSTLAEIRADITDEMLNPVL